MKIIFFCAGVQLGLLAGVVAMFIISTTSNKAVVVYESKDIVVWRYNKTVWESPKLTDYRDAYLRLPKR